MARHQLLLPPPPDQFFLLLPARLDRPPPQRLSFVLSHPRAALQRSRGSAPDCLLHPNFSSFNMAKSKGAELISFFESCDAKEAEP